MTTDSGAAGPAQDPADSPDQRERQYEKESLLNNKEQRGLTPAEEARLAEILEEEARERGEDPPGRPERGEDPA